MTRDEALEFLRKHQPLPDDDALEGELIGRFDEVRKYFAVHLEPDAVPLLLNSFGSGSGFGVYQLVEDTVAKAPSDVVVSHLAKALASPHRGVRYWNAQLAARFPHTRLLAPLNELLRDADSDIRYAAVTAVEQIDDTAAANLLRRALDEEADAEVRALTPKCGVHPRTGQRIRGERGSKVARTQAPLKPPIRNRGKTTQVARRAALEQTPSTTEA